MCPFRACTKPETTKRNHRNETTETSETTEMKRPKRLFVSVVSFRSFRWFRSFRFARFGGFGGFVSLVSLVSVISFRWFRFVVSGFSTCRHFRHASGMVANSNCLTGLLIDKKKTLLMHRRSIYGVSAKSTIRGICLLPLNIRQLN